MTNPVLITGAGPTGLTAALELSRLGHAVRLIDKREAPADTSRAIGVQARTLELFEQRGLSDEMLKLGNQGRFGSIYGGGSRVFRLDFSHVESAFPFILFISQAETERILRDALQKLGVVPEWKTEMVALAQQDAFARSPTPVSAVLQHDDGRLERTAAPALIASEGAHSIARTTLDIPFGGHTRDEHYALGDLLITGDLPETDFHIFSSDHGFMGLFPMGGERFRLIASNPLSAPSHDTAPSLEQLQKIYDQRSHIPARFHDLNWSSWFTINSRMVPRLRIGRIFLGGDSAHIHSPAGAQGMNTGIQDMINLSWKLGAVLAGAAPEALLDTYEDDRLPVMRGVLQRTDTLTTTIGTSSAIVRGLFNYLGPFFGGSAPVQETATAGMSQMALGYRDSPLSATHAHPGSLRAGDRLPDFAVTVKNTTTRLHAVLDPLQWTLLAVPHDGASEPQGLDSFGSSYHFAEITPAAAAGAKAAFKAAFGSGGIAVLVRPDGYAGLICHLDDAAKQIATYRQRWWTSQ